MKIGTNVHYLLILPLLLAQEAYIDFFTTSCSMRNEPSRTLVTKFEQCTHTHINTVLHFRIILPCGSTVPHIQRFLDASCTNPIYDTEIMNNSCVNSPGVLTDTFSYVLIYQNLPKCTKEFPFRKFTPAEFEPGRLYRLAEPCRRGETYSNNATFIIVPETCSCQPWPSSIALSASYGCQNYSLLTRFYWTSHCVAEYQFGSGIVFYNGVCRGVPTTEESVLMAWVSCGCSDAGAEATTVAPPAPPKPTGHRRLKAAIAALSVCLAITAACCIAFLATSVFLYYNGVKYSKSCFSDVEENIKNLELQINTNQNTRPSGTLPGSARSSEISQITGSMRGSAFTGSARTSAFTSSRLSAMPLSFYSLTNSLDPSHPPLRFPSASDNPSLRTLPSLHSQSGPSLIVHRASRGEHLPDKLPDVGEYDQLFSSIKQTSHVIPDHPHLSTGEYMSMHQYQRVQSPDSEAISTSAATVEGDREYPHLLRFHHNSSESLADPYDVALQSSPGLQLNLSSAPPDSAPDLDPVESITLHMDSEDSLIQTYKEHTDGELLIPSGDVHLHEEIGEGSFGKVFKGLYHGAEVAMKFIDGCDESGRNDIFREFAFLKKCDRHPCVVKMFGYCDDAEKQCLVMEFINGGSLAVLNSEIKSGDREPFPKIVQYEIMTKAASAIVHLHSKGVIHSDIAARNFLASRDLTTVKVCDFGLSRKATSKLSKSRLNDRGAVRWCSPEALSGHFSKESDVWAFGCFIYEMMEKEPPYGWLSPQKVRHQLKERGLRPFPGDHWDEDLQELCMSCWDRDVAKRPSMKTVQERLSFMGGHGRHVDDHLSPKSRQSSFLNNAAILTLSQSGSFEVDAPYLTIGKRTVSRQKRARTLADCAELKRGECL